MPNVTGLVEATVETLDGGKCIERLNDRMHDAWLDVLGRPTIKKKRTLTLVIDLEPVLDEDGQCLGAGLDWTVKMATPPVSGRVTTGLREGQNLYVTRYGADARQSDVEEITNKVEFRVE